MLRIGEVARRAGVSTELLRAWERRYGLLEPERSPGGFRLYAEADVERVLRMRALLESGMAAAEAARTVREDGASQVAAAGPGELLDALLAFDEARAQEVVDRLLATYSLEAVLRDAFLPTMRAVGERWLGGEASVAHEHFASNLIGGRLRGLARGWDRGGGPRALLALPPGERHELGLLAFGIALRGHGWRITYLGADTPIETLAETAARLRPAIVVLAAAGAEQLDAVVPALARVAAGYELALGGPAATEELAARVGARLLDAEVVAAAAAVAAA